MHDQPYVVSREKFIRSLLSPDVPLQILSAGFARLPLQWNNQRHFVRHTLSGHLLWGIAKGELQVNRGSQVIPIPTGAVMRIHGLRDAWFSMADGCAEVDVYFLRFRIGQESSFAVEHPLSVTPNVASMPETFSRLLAAARRENADEFSQQQLRVRLSDLLIDLFSRDSAEAALKVVRPEGLSERQQQRCLEFIESNISRFFTLTEVADYCQLNPAYLSSRFTKTFGQSFQSYVKASRIKEAQSLLLDTAMTVGDIANSLGFRDIYYFSRQFKEVAGISPTQWRQNHS